MLFRTASVPRRSSGHQPPADTAPSRFNGACLPCKGRCRAPARRRGHTPQSLRDSSPSRGAMTVPARARCVIVQRDVREAVPYNAIQVSHPGCGRPRGSELRHERRFCARRGRRPRRPVLSPCRTTGRPEAVPYSRIVRPPPPDACCRLAVPGKRCGLALFLAFSDRCANCSPPSSATGSGGAQFPIA